MTKRKVDLGGDASEGLTHSPFAGLRRTTAPDAQVERSQGASDLSGAEEGAARGQAAPPHWHVRKERKGRGGKVVTVVSLLSEGGAGDLGRVAKTLGQRLGTGARVKGEGVVVQGALSERIRALLEADGARVTVGS
ncbi:MAG: translation initiation factor [Planctomycetota bacterium]|nr:translation initiation factor [Planctomycetota bacterium]MDG1984239.1 translation initiation factor [Planctomycetota bacterium]